ncbi:ATP synthase F1, gamma subunit [Elusimicrobium minutum Pei191]|uniref:ATP synthase gamma chain n=1 Tax=Elusimicrobium minutum (strain Pei191) TaxID=445932 RepID=ATPG_ELUMP|nr:ATP synthase F1 subunit gamma [Elusimicrobium minutum]B2KEX2.1 RecName: Full=ATP synthase gamma chain; AltName: Full=ATP synthase F1 sector gamma subunit; AltName: Full=F-ATPase gamma subunit [Elusimicrobium minutum Pei191]ACC99068.1 ATP synthase F1, gamma subunit [Elusimicrobium minutum Pei191]
MESLKDIRDNIKSVQSTQQVMVTMKMISSARIKKAQNAMLNARPFSLGLEGVIDDLRKDILDENNSFKDPDLSKFFKKPDMEKKNIGVLFITADKGLAGAFNALLLRAALNFIKENQDKNIYFFIIGKKGRDFLSRLKQPNVHIVYDAVGIFPKVGYVHADILGEEIINNFLKLDLCEVRVLYNDFKSMGSQKLENQRLIPFDFEIAQGHTEFGEEEHGFLFEPGKEMIFKLLLYRHIKAGLYRILLESQAAELAARMNAMDSASKNAGEIIDTLKVKLNKVRQSSITNEITEIVGAVEALNK